ncbi:MAG: STAS-like domain-containing protein [Gammaproteobacteria bacterium]|nr:STAS-like domain-containing protein [Gammaproteobacteria bacterium]
MKEHIIDVARDFTDRPFGRYRDDGNRSGEVFREDILVPALRKYDHVTVNLGGTNFYGSSFLEEVFGGLVRRHFSRTELKQKLTVVHDKLPSVVKEAEKYIRKAEEAQS